MLVIEPYLADAAQDPPVTGGRRQQDDDTARPFRRQRWMWAGPAGRGVPGGARLGGVGVRRAGVGVGGVRRWRW